MGIVFVILTIAPTMTWHAGICLTVGPDNSLVRTQGSLIHIFNLRTLKFREAPVLLGGQELGVRRRKEGLSLT